MLERHNATVPCVNTKSDEKPIEAAERVLKYPTEILSPVGTRKNWC